MNAFKFLVFSCFPFLNFKKKLFCGHIGIFFHKLGTTFLKQFSLNKFVLFCILNSRMYKNMSKLRH